MGGSGFRRPASSFHHLLQFWQPLDTRRHTQSRAGCKIIPRDDFVSRIEACIRKFQYGLCSKLQPLNKVIDIYGITVIGITSENPLFVSHVEEKFSQVSSGDDP